MSKYAEASGDNGNGGKTVIVISNCSAHNCNHNPRGPLNGIASLGSSVSSEYNAICECLEQGDGQCHCGQRLVQLDRINWLNPTNWKHWPIIKKSLLVLSVAVVLLWLVVYLYLHFYVQTL